MIIDRIKVFLILRANGGPKKSEVFTKRLLGNLQPSKPVGALGGVKHKLKRALVLGLELSS